MSENNLFPRKKDIFQKSTKDVQNIIGRPSIDTQYQAIFSFGNYQNWLESTGNAIGKSRTNGLDFREKMSIMCTEAEIPGTSFETNLAVGHHQGIQEEFPSLRNFPPLNLTFYVDADHVILEVLETWMTFINPIQNNKEILTHIVVLVIQRTTKRLCTSLNLKEMHFKVTNQESLHMSLSMSFPRI